MVGIFRRIYDWLLSLFWYVLLLCSISAMGGVVVVGVGKVGALQPDPHRLYNTTNDDNIFLAPAAEHLANMESPGRRRWTSP